MFTNPVTTCPGWGCRKLLLGALLSISSFLPAGMIAAWKELQLRKEVVVTTMLKEDEGKEGRPQDREGVPHQECWRRVLQAVDASPEAILATDAARDSVELPLLLDC